MAKLLIFSSILFIQTTLWAQTDSIIYYFDKDLNLCEKSDAIITGTGINKDKRFKFKAWYTKTGIPLFDGNFLDSTLSIKDGFFTYYDSNGIKESEGNFHENDETGIWLIWVDKLVGDSIYYEKGKRIIHKSFRYHHPGQLSSKTVTNTKEGFLETTEWYTDGKIKSVTRTEGENGTETKFYPNGNIEAKINFRSGKPTKEKYYHEDGTEMTKEESAKKKRSPGNNSSTLPTGAPDFPGGPGGFQSFFSQNYRRPQNANEGDIPQSVTVTFELDKAGFASNIKVSGTTNRTIENEIINVFRRMPAWNMNGHKHWGPISINLYL